jgi:pectin methylesterase-like acyl-CoA thioesterase
MQKVKYIFTIWLLILLPLAISAQTLLPSNNASNVCIDMQFKLTFSANPVLQSSGKVRLYESGGNLISTIDMASMPSGTPMSATWPWKETLTGTAINVFRAVVDGRTAIFSFPINSLQYGKNYYVTVDKSVFSNASALGFNGIAANQWTFKTKMQPASDRDYTVAADGSGDFATLQGALDFIPNGNTNATKIYIKNGTYIGLVYSKNKNNITFEGESTNGVIIKAFNNSNLNASTHWRAVVYIQGKDLYLTKTTMINSTPLGGSQAEALTLSGDRVIITNCKFFSYQDTQLLSGKVYLKDCLIEGDVDFIWGTGTVFYQSCELRANDNGGYNAMARNDNTRHGYAFADCKLTRKTSATSTQYLARDAGATYPHAEVVYLNCSMDKHIPAIGWQIGSSIDASKAVFAEYQSVDMSGNPINTSSRHAKSRQLSSNQAKQYRDLNWFFNGWTPHIPETISTISIESPIHNSVFNAPSIISFSANISGTTGNISKVEFFNGSTLLGLGTANGTNYTFIWTDAPIRTYSIIAKATYQNGAVITSTPITIKVYDCAGVTNGTAYLDECGICIAGNTGKTACSGAIQGEDFCEAIGIQEDKNLGFIGTGYINFDNKINSSGIWYLNSKFAKTASIGFRYANGGNDARSISVSVNGTIQKTLIGAPTGSWTTWNTEYLNLNLSAGVNKIVLTSNTADGGPNLDLIAFSDTDLQPGGCTADCNGIVGGTAFVDNCQTCVGGNTGKSACIQDCNGDWDGIATLDNCGTCIGGNTINKACSGFMEAENACSVDGILLEDKNTGFSGLGYVNADNTIDAGFSWNMISTSAQITTLSFRYANAGSNSRDGDLYVNGAKITNVKLPSTGSWTTWEMASVDIALANGVNEITLKATTLEGLANIDLIAFSEGVSEGMCIITGKTTGTNSKLSIHPNPTHNQVFWNAEKDWILLDIQGKELAKGKGNSTDLSDLPNGVYFLKIDQTINKVFKN